MAKTSKKIYDNIGLLIFPSNSEAEPLIIYVAISNGIPIITKNRGCIKQMLSKNSDYFIDINRSFQDVVKSRVEGWLNNSNYQEYSKKIFQIFEKNKKLSLREFDDFINLIS